MDKPVLNFGTFSGIVKTSIDAEIKTALSLDGGQGICTVKGSSISDSIGEDGEVTSRKLQIILHGVDGGGCTDTITTKSPSIFKSGLEKLKYLFDATGVAFPASCLAPVKLANATAQGEFYNRVYNALVAYQTQTGVELSAESISTDADGNIVILSKALFEEMLGSGDFGYIYTDLDAVNAERRAHRARQRKINEGTDKELVKSQLEAENTAYLAFLDGQPVAPCEINEQAFNDAHNGLQAIAQSEAPVFVKAKDYNRKVRSYAKIKA